MKLSKKYGFFILTVVVLLILFFIYQNYLVEGASNMNTHTLCPNPSDEMILIKGKGRCTTKKISPPSGFKMFGGSIFGFVSGIKAENGTCPINYQPVYKNKNYCFSLKPSKNEQIKCPNGYSYKLFQGAQYCTANPRCPRGKKLSEDHTICK
jgi:hypothetical protein